MVVGVGLGGGGQVKAVEGTGIKVKMMEVRERVETHDGGALRV